MGDIQVASSAPKFEDAGANSISNSSTQAVFSENPISPQKNNKLAIKLMISIGLVLIIGSIIYILHSRGVGYKVTTVTIPQVKSVDFFKKDSQPLQLRTKIYNNNFITPRRITFTGLDVCLTDIEFKKSNIKLVSTYTIDLMSPFGSSNNLKIKPGEKIWLYPLSTLMINYFINGDWYDYIYQYLDYDEIDYLGNDSANSNLNCSNLLSAENIEKIQIDKSNCVGCVNQAANGPDLAVIDFISNDNKIWEQGYISFIPIIKNVGSEPAGSFEVIYYLNGNHLSSFQLENLNSGEIVNNFIAGSGFKGNFADKKPDMQLKIEVKTLQLQDVNVKNNLYEWNFQFIDTSLPKHTCKFTDNNQGPQDFYMASSIDYSGKKYSDLCIDDNYLLEYECDTHPVYNGDDNIEVFLYKCPLGCNQGKCTGSYTK